jgi:hypothetical protein
MNDAAHSRLKSRNVHSEIVFALNPSNNVRPIPTRLGYAHAYVLSPFVISPFVPQYAGTVIQFILGQHLIHRGKY